MEILLTITYTLIFIFIIHKMKFFEAKGISKKTITLIFITKICFGILLWAIYTYYYTERATADIYKYFDDSKIMFDALKKNPSHYFKMLLGIENNTPEFDNYYNEMHYWKRRIDSNIYNDSHTIIRFNAFIRLFSMGYYNVHTVVICFLSLTGLMAIYKTFEKHLQDKKKELIAIVFLLPSVLFWGSGVLKEGLIFFALGLLIYYAQQLFSVKSILIVLSMALLLAFSKFYIWIAIFPSLIYMLFINKVSRKFILATYLIIILALGIIGLKIESFSSFQNPLVTLSQKQIEFNQLASGELSDSNEKKIPPANSRIEINKLEPTFISFIKNSPQAIVNCVLRPYLWENKSITMLMSGVENIFIVLFILFALVFIKPPTHIPWQYVIFCLSFVVIQYLIIGETTPILGAVARYKTVALPFLLLAFLFMMDKEKILAKIPYLKKILV